MKLRYGETVKIIDHKFFTEAQTGVVVDYVELDFRLHDTSSNRYALKYKVRLSDKFKEYMWIHESNLELL